MDDERHTIFEGSSGEGEHRTDHGGRSVATALARQGVQVAFTLCGGHVLPVLDGCLSEGIRVVDARHEQAAVMMAAGYAYATREPGVCAITAGPGFTNAVTGLADANHSGVPLVAISGRTPVKAWKRGAIQDVDQLAIARVVTKHAHTCYAPERIGEHVTEAFWHARAPRQGVAYVEIPTDVLMAPATNDLSWAPGFPAEVAAPHAAADAIREAITLLEAAERPVLVAGSGPFWGRADDALRRFADTTQIPVTTTGPARGLLPDSHPTCLGGLVHGGVAVLQADVVVVCGSRFDGNMIFGGPPLFGPWQKIVQVDVRAEAFGGNRAPDLAVQGDAAHVLEQLTEAWTGPPKNDWLEQALQSADGSRDAWRSQEDDAVDGVHSGTLARIVNEVVMERTGGACTLVADGGDILTWGVAHFEAERPGRVLTTGTALGTLGVGLPFAIGAKAARPGEPVVLLAGDGAFGLSAMEVDTAARMELPVVCVISSNGAWGDVAYEQGEWFGPGRTIATDLGRPHYEKLAEMVGGFGASVEKPDELRPALEEALDSGKTAVVNVRTDPNVVSEILRGIGQLGVM